MRHHCQEVKGDDDGQAMCDLPQQKQSDQVRLFPRISLLLLHAPDPSPGPCHVSS